jgi:hypothetical protein
MEYLNRSEQSEEERIGTLYFDLSLPGIAMAGFYCAPAAIAFPAESAALASLMPD